MSTPCSENVVCSGNTLLRATASILTRPCSLRAIAAFVFLPLAATAWASALPAPTIDQVQEKMAAMAVPFEANQGQFAPEVAFAARTFAGTLFVTKDGRIVHALAGKPERKKEAQKRDEATVIGHTPDDRGSKTPTPRGPGWALVESLQGAGELAPVGSQPSATRVSRFAGGTAPNQTSRVSTFDRVRLGEAWPGVSVELAARGSNVEKLFTIAPDADAKAIRLRVAGANSLRLSKDGSLIAATDNGTVAFTPPVAFQDIDGQRSAVSVRYKLLADNSYRFELKGGYDRSKPLVIDPLLQATYLGGSRTDQAFALALDASGNVLVAGETTFNDFPGTSGGAQPANGGNEDAFVARLSSNLTTLLQATYLGGTNTEVAYGLALDASGNVFVAGVTGSANFPGTTGGAQPAIGGVNATAAFVARLSSSLTTLVQATYLGGSGSTGAQALKIDSSGKVLVAGYTTSIDFPGTSGGAQTANGGALDAFVARLSNTLTTLTQSTYVGGSGDEGANALALDAGGNVFVAGNTQSSNFPGTTGGAQPASGAFGDAFVARLSSTLTTLAQATYLGGNSTDVANAMALDASGSVFVAGDTTSTDFPGATGGAQPTYGGGFRDGFVARLSNSLTSLAQSTYLGGSADDRAFALAIDAVGNVFVAGGTVSANFPSTAGGAQPASGGFEDIFVARLSNALTTLGQATYVGGNGNDEARAMALDASGTVFVAGYTQSADFPGTAGGAQPVIRAADAVIAKLTLDGSASAFTVTATAGANGSVSPVTQMVASGNTATVTVTPNSGFMINSVSGCGVGTLSGNTYTTAPVTANCTVTATFTTATPVSFTVTATAGANGNVSPASQMVASGSTATVTVTPSSGFVISSVSGCGGSLSGNTYTTAPVTANCTVTATFTTATPVNFTVTATAGANGNVSPATQMVASGNTATVTVTPNSGFMISSVSGCGGSLSGNTYITAPVTADCTVTATFSASSATAIATPTLSQWALAVLTVLLAGVALRLHRRQLRHREVRRMESKLRV